MPPSYLPPRDVTTETLSFIQCLSWQEPRSKQYAWFAMLRWNAIVKPQICGSIGFPQWVNGGWRRHTAFCLLHSTHILKRGPCSLCLQALPSHYDDMNTRISSPAAPKVTLLAFDYFIWENYRHITYTAAASSSWQPVKITVWFNVKKLWQKYISLLCIGEKLSQWTDSFDVVFSHFLNQIFFTF